jgi:hypothetical protein
MKKIIALIVLIIVSASVASAIPAFARKYGYSCEICHAPIPRLKAFGEEFMDNGYRIPDKEPPRATIDTGDPILLLQRELPLAMRFDGFASYEPNAAGVKGDFRTPFVMKILSGGNISDKISYYTYFLMTEESKLVGLEDTYLYFHDLFGLPLSFVFGQYRVSDPIKPSEIRMTFEEYKIFKFTVGDSKIALSYDRGLMAGYGTKFGMDFSLQVVNGNGIDEQEIFDSDKYKSVVYRVAQSLWKDIIRIGILGYTGREAMLGGLTNRVTYFGPDIRLRLPKLELMFEFVHRTDSHPFNRIEFDATFAPEPQNQKTDAILAEAVFAPQGDKSRMFFTLAFNDIAASLEEVKYRTLTLNICHVLRRNLKWIAEYTHDLVRDNHRLLTGIITAF